MSQKKIRLKIKIEMIEEARTRGKKGRRRVKLVYSIEYTCPLIIFLKIKMILTNQKFKTKLVDIPFSYKTAIYRWIDQWTNNVQVIFAFVQDLAFSV